MIDNNVIEYIDKLIDCYELYDIQEEEQKVMIFIKKSLDSAVWHDRTAHLNHWNMLKMRNLVKKIKKLKTSSSFEKICEFCMIERQQAEISRFSMTYVIKILKLLHLNLIELLSIVWIDDYSYFLLIKNDFSLLIFVYSLKLKSETHHKLIEFKTLMKKQINMKVKRLQVDEEDEFRGHKWENWCKETEIKLKSSAFYIFQQNEKTEWSMYTLMTSVRSILKEKKLSKALWLKLVKAVTYVKNRCSRINEVTLFQTDNEFQSNISNLQALECRAWVHVSKIIDHHKLDNHFWQDIMINYEEVNQWWIYNSMNRKIHVSWDIKFDELNIYDSFFDEELGEIWNEENDSLFNETIIIVNDLTIENSFEKSQYSTLIFNDAATLVEAETLKNIEEEKNNEKFNLLLHIFKSSEHVISQKIMRSSTDKSVSKVTKNESAQKQQQKKQKKIKAQSKSKAKNVVSASTQVIRSSKFNVQSDYKKLNEDFSANKISVIFIKSEVLILTFKSEKVAKSHVHIMKVLHILISDETLNLELAHDELKMYKKAKALLDWSLWMKVMKIEVNFLIENEIWELITSSNDRSKSLINRWVFKIKYELDENILKYKAHWVVHEYKQQYEIDYNKIWSKVVKSAIFRMMFDIAATHDLHIEQMNVIIVFLYEFLNKLIYVKQSHDFVIDFKLICRLRKALYDLKQASRVWSVMIWSFLNKLNFHEIKSDKSLFVSEDKKMFIAIYVDNLLIIEADMSRIDKIKTELKSTFKMTDLDSTSHYLNMKIRRDTFAVCKVN